tara:strand:+ start:620 stop:1801 length:1182 start_codon:yes stop_codon:yes gene_type:complete
MAATDKGIWSLQDVRDKQLQDEWEYVQLRNLYMTGVGTNGSMGINIAGPNAKRSSPTQLPGSWQSFSATYQNAAGVKTDGTLWSWGQNSNGSVGDESTTSYSSPVQVGSGTDWNEVMMQTPGSCFAVKTDGSLWSWGNNNYGMLGHNNKTDYSSPKQVGSDTTWNGAHGQLDGGQYSVGAIKTDGTFWRWGDNEKGQLGHNNKTDYSSPKQVPGTWTYFSAGWQSSLQIKGGNLYFCGWGEKSAAGGSGTSYSSPKQLPGSPGAGPFGTVTRCCSMEDGTGLVINTDGELFSWGYNTKGQCGKNTNNNATQYYSPQQIPGTTWEHVDSARQAVFATKTDGTLWAWGKNNAGQLGHNNETQRSSPTQVGSGTSWELYRTKSYFAGAMGIVESFP